MSDKNSIVENVTSLYTNAKKEWTIADSRSKTCMEFVLNKQWTATEISRFTAQGLPPIVYNYILSRLNNLRGTEQLNRRSLIFKAFFEKDKELASILGGNFNHVWNLEHGEYELSKVFADGLILTRPGLLKILVEPDETGFFDYKYRHTNPYAVTLDPTHTDYRLRDCDYVIEETWLTLEQIIDTYGKQESETLEGYDKTWWQKLGDKIAEAIDGLFGYSDPDSNYQDQRNNKFKILEMQTRIKVKNYLFIDKVTGEYFLFEEKPEEVPENLRFVSERMVPRIHITTVSPYHNLVLFDGLYWIKTDMYDIIPYYSFDLSNAKSQEPSSLVWAMLDPQRNLNKRQIQKTGYIDRAMVAPLAFSMEDRDAKEDYDENGNLPGYSMLIRNLKFPPHRISPNQMPAEVWNDLIDSTNSLNDISGINDTARGQSEHANESARLFQSKLERVGATVNPYLHNLTITRIMIGEYYLKSCGQVYPELNRMVKTLDQQKKTGYAILNEYDGSTIRNQVSSFHGQVVTDEGDYSISKLQENMQSKLAYAQIMPPELVNWRWILKDSDLPDIEEQIDYIDMVLGIQTQKGNMEEAMAVDGYVQQQAAQKKQLQLQEQQIKAQAEQAKAKGKTNANGK